MLTTFESDNDRTQSYTVLPAGTLISHYKIIEKIGSGGMGEVYLAEDSELKRKVALKFLPLQYASDENFKTRFKREAQAAASFKSMKCWNTRDGRFLPWN